MPCGVCCFSCSIPSCNGSGAITRLTLTQTCFENRVEVVLYALFLVQKLPVLAKLRLTAPTKSLYNTPSSPDHSTNINLEISSSAAQASSSRMASLSASASTPLVSSSKSAKRQAANSKSATKSAAAHVLARVATTRRKSSS
jgi:hypothetical protein